MLPDSAFRQPRQPKTRLGLPITIDSHGKNATVLACADTGAEVNVMSESLARALDYTYDANATKKEFVLANGKIVESIGELYAPCSFGVETDIVTAMSCMFYVLQQVAGDMIMGLAFLEKTKTMTEHRQRLVRVPRHAFQALSVCAIDRPQQLLRCDMKNQTTLVTMDSGSEIDLMSPQLAFDRGYEILPGEFEIELADGSIATTKGFTSVTLTVSSPTQHMRMRSQATADFYLLDNLFHEVIVGQDTQEELRVFKHHQDAIVQASEVFGPLGLNLIRLLGRADRMISWVKDKFRRRQDRTDGKLYFCWANLCTRKTANILSHS